jgi:N-acetylglucosamine kinase-like BadF-type ATPase
MLERVVMGLDVGNTKTLAVIADTTGRVLGYGRSTQANIYVHYEKAVHALKSAYQQALTMSGLTQVDHIAMSAAGADWPEDFSELREVAKDIATVTNPDYDLTVVNDAIGAIWSGAARGEGVAVVVGTSAGIGARYGENAWHSSYWQEPEGAVHLGQKTLRTIYRAELGLEPPTRLTEAVLNHLALESVEAVLHAFTARGSVLGNADIGGLAKLLLNEAECGDTLAQKIVEEHARSLGDYALVAARKVGLTTQAFPLILTGGVMRHSSPIFKDALVERVRQEAPHLTVQAPNFEPVGGAVCVALDALDCHTPEARSLLQKTLPQASFYST